MINEFIFLALNIIIKYVGKHNGKHILRMHKESYNETIHFKTTCGGDAVLKKTSISLSFIASALFANLQKYQSVSADCPLLNRILQVFIILLCLQSTHNIHNHLRSSSHQS